MYKKKLIQTREEVEMMKNGLIDVFNLPITYQSKLIEYKDCRRTLREIIKGFHNQPVYEELSRYMLRWKVPAIDMTDHKTEDVYKRQVSTYANPLAVVRRKTVSKVIECPFNKSNHCE